MIRTIASDTLWEKGKKKKERKKKKEDLILASCPQSCRQNGGCVWTHEGLSSPSQHHGAVGGREKEGRGKFPHPFPSALAIGPAVGLAPGAAEAELAEIPEMLSQRGHAWLFLDKTSSNGFALHGRSRPYQG